MNLSGSAICLLIAVTAVSATLNDYVFEFGDKNIGQQIIVQEGDIPLLSYTNEIPLQIPRQTRLTYVKVTVRALSAPKVDLDSDTNKLTINYSWTQITYGSYKILVKGIPNY